MTTIRLANLEDIDELVQMRWDFSCEDYGISSVSYEQFYSICSEFLLNAIKGDWLIWVAEIENRLVSHMYVQLIQKVPRPGKPTKPVFAYVTNVYTRPSFRNQGIGTSLHQAIEAWSTENKVEFLIVWPSENSVQFYARNGFTKSGEAMEKHL